jgi:hypothetical protein
MLRSAWTSRTSRSESATLSAILEKALARLAVAGRNNLSALRSRAVLHGRLSRRPPAVELGAPPPASEPLDD